MTKRKLVVNTAQYWYTHAHKVTFARSEIAYTQPERFLYMENALNHTENMLAFVLRDLLGMENMLVGVC